MAKIALNGLGRMGKLALRELFDRGLGDQIVLLNDLNDDISQHALLLEFDSVHGRWNAEITHAPGHLVVNGHKIPLTSHRRIEDLPLASRGVDLVIDCTGAFKTPDKLAPYKTAGVRKTIISAPVKDPAALNLVYGINHQDYDPARHDIITAASCTTNCLAPVVQVLQSEIGISHGSMTTIHDVTNTQTMVDKPHKDPRRARSALTNLIPTTTGSATAITLIFPELKGKLNGHAVRVPLLNASLTDCTFEMQRATSVEEVNALFKSHAEGALKGILGYETRPLVSSDFTHDRRSAIVDAPSTMVVNGTQVKLYVWYDNEWGYVCRLVDIAEMVAGSM
jgi:glyceraldehyde 3-phosphate dehydrogenase